MIVWLQDLQLQDLFVARIQHAIHTSQGAEVTIDDFRVYKDDPNTTKLVVEPTEEQWRITKRMWQGHRIAHDAAMRK